MKTPFDLIAESGIPALLVGGHALHVYRYTRQTLDFDFMVATTDYARLRNYLQSVGFSEQGRMGQFGRFRTGPQSDPVLDVGTVDPSTFAKLWEASQEHRWNEAVLRVPSFLHLIALKLHAAKNPHRIERDIGDVWELLRLNPNAFTQAELEATCLRHGPPGVYTRLKEARPYEYPQL